MQAGPLYQEFLTKYGINLVMEYLPASTMTKSEVVRRSHEGFYPLTSGRRCFSITLRYLRRIPKTGRLSSI